MRDLVLKGELEPAPQCSDGNSSKRCEISLNTSSWPEPSCTGRRAQRRCCDPAGKPAGLHRSRRDGCGNSHFSGASSAGKNAEGYIFPLRKLRGVIKHSLISSKPPALILAQRMSRVREAKCQGAAPERRISASG